MRQRCPRERNCSERMSWNLQAFRRLGDIRPFFWVCKNERRCFLERTPTQVVYHLFIPTLRSLHKTVNRLPKIQNGERMPCFPQVIELFQNLLSKLEISECGNVNGSRVWPQCAVITVQRSFVRERYCNVIVPKCNSCFSEYRCLRDAGPWRKIVTNKQAWGKPRKSKRETMTRVGPTPQPGLSELDKITIKCGKQ